MKKFVTLILTLTLLLSLCAPVSAASDEEYAAAQRLYELNLFKGRGTGADGEPDFDLDSPATREEAVVMLLRLENRWQAEQVSGEGCPFTDVSDWALGYLEYAYRENLVKGRSETFFDAKSPVTAAEYLTMVLRALWYHSEAADTYEKDFDWDRPWLLSDRIGLTNGEYSKSTTDFTRGDMAKISAQALDCDMNGNEGYTKFKHICAQGGLHGIENERELYAGWYSDGESVYRCPRMRLVSMEFAGSTQLCVYMDDLYLLLAAATGVLEAQDDGGVDTQYTQYPSARNYREESWVRDYGTFGMEHYVEKVSMSHEGRNVIYSIPYNDAFVRTWELGEEPGMIDTSQETPGVLSLKFAEVGAVSGEPGLLNFCEGVRFFRYTGYDYAENGKNSLAGYPCGFPSLVNADDFLAYFGLDYTLKLTDSTEGLVWSLEASEAPEQAR